MPAPSDVCRVIPPGRFLDDDLWAKLDSEVHRLQDKETRTDAENTSLRDAASGWQLGWKVLLGAAVAGLAGGIYLGAKL